MKRNRLIFFVTIAVGVVLLGACAFFLVDRRSVEQRFPVWREAVEREGWPAVNPDVSLTLDRIDYRVDSDGKFNDILTVTAGSSRETACGMGYWVDYFWEGTWYTVYGLAEVPDIAQILPEGNTTLEYRVPAGLFRPKGEYRLYLDGLGYCALEGVSGS